MDNLTHSLFGAAVAETYIEKRFKNSAFRPPKNIFYFFSIFANNCPDLDLLFGLIDNTSLGYMLNHRGWTHTVVGTLPQSVLLIFLAWVWIHFFRRDLLVYFKDLVFLILFGMQTHMLLDYFNSYGVHPWAPLDNRWYYLDSIFIIEPLLWFSLISIWLPPWKWRSVLLLAPLGAYGFGWWNQFVSSTTVVAALGFAALAFQLQAVLLKMYRGLVGVALFTLVVLTFWGGQHWARTQILQELVKDESQKNLDAVLYSLPSNPLCWFFLVPQVKGDQYTVVHGSVALWGSSKDCQGWPRPKMNEGVSMEESSLGRLWIKQRWSASLRDLKPLMNRCDVKAWMQFARIPYWENSVLNDLRFAARGGKSFTTHELQDGAEPICPVLDVPWQPPRQDLLDIMNSLDD